MDKKEFLENMKWRLKCETEQMQKTHDRILRLQEIIEEYTNMEMVE